jgi:hypothetical protein
VVFAKLAVFTKLAVFDGCRRLVCTDSCEWIGGVPAACARLVAGPLGVPVGLCVDVHTKWDGVVADGHEPGVLPRCAVVPVVGDDTPAVDGRDVPAR